ncbi:MAG: hypothetical protein ABI647_00590 [Gemmatimonadota bacterium]
MTPRPTPFDLVFGEAERERLSRLREAIATSDLDPRERDRFVLDRFAVEWLTELRPEEGVGEGVAEFVAFLHAGYLFWADGEAVVEVGREALERLLRDPPGLTTPASGIRPYYFQIAPQRVWGAAALDSGPEPLDGCFVVPQDRELMVVAVFGLYAGRPGFTAVEVGGHRPGRLARLDQTPLFAPTMSGGAAAGLYSLAGSEELLELAWRVHEQLAAGPAPGRQELILA